jgi:diacylglycerol kinase
VYTVGMQEGSQTKRKIFNLKRADNALRGVRIFIGHNGYLHLLFALIPMVLGWYFKISSTEWLFVIISIGSVMTAEALNTAIEIHMDLTSPDFHPHARDTKDVAAGAVLITSLMALVVGLIIFVPKLILLLR